MSGNYAYVVCARGAVSQGIVANATTLLGAGVTDADVAAGIVGPGSYIFGKGTLFKILKAQVRINTAATSATQSFQVQKSDSAGSFSSPTAVATVTITSSDAAGALLSATVADGSTDVDNSNGTNLYALRLVHVATSTDATLNYDFAVYYSYPHC